MDCAVCGAPILAGEDIRDTATGPAHSAETRCIGVSVQRVAERIVQMQAEIDVLATRVAALEGA